MARLGEFSSQDIFFRGGICHAWRRTGDVLATERRKQSGERETSRAFDGHVS